MDPDTALILQLLREDAEQAAAVARGKGKNPEGTQTDAQVALNVFLTDLLTTEAFLADQKMALSIQRAVQLDGDALFQSEEEERRARRDRNMSLALSTGQDGVTASEAGPGAPSDDPEYLEKLQYLYVTGIDTITEDNVNISDDETLVNSQPESSRWAASRPAKKQPQKRECAACGDLKHFAQLAKAPCQHEYCRECLTHLFRDATLDESLFPPRCCKQTIPLDKNRLFLDYDVVQLFRKKAVEFSTPRRTYCHDRNCGAFIPQTNYVDDTATCVECRRQTCITCKNAHHGGDCPNDEQLQGVIQLARQQGWQRCQNCWGMVELNMGCYHMT
ncbi:hypothetical protein GGS23DRAFT_383649 [Durotheca rogersii]|uniref:uncharacterized protein n=1 Tax=Durotheca rogersii TaxID=419775 RepID=UPI00221F1EFE|nr:uncharacterized protein GGS23DRAFT_383649 [Durotheca rogersii]KAI5866354.1 hypothetical protein GGS23DRAFT_383649 [Durotheca rogersii]